MEEVLYSKSGVGLSVSKISFQETSKPNKVSLMDNRHQYRMFHPEAPDNIEEPDLATMEETCTHAAFDTKLKDRAKSETTVRGVRSGGKSDTVMKVYATTISLDDIHIDYTMNTEEGFISDEAALEIAPSAFYLPKQYPLMSFPPEVIIVLKETETCFLFGLPSYSYEKNSLEAEKVDKENELYQYMTVGKGKNRKMVVEETQTKEFTTQSRHTMATRPAKKNAAAFASLWDMHDTYVQAARARPEPVPDAMVLYQSAAPGLLRRDKKKASPETDLSRGKTFEQIAGKPEFFDAALLVERVLAAKTFSDAQKRFRGLVPFNPLSLDLIYVYTMKPLWVLECEETINRPILSASFNPRNENILAIAHGKFSYSDTCDGLVAVWCTKNPCKPERCYRFDDPLTALQFSAVNPNWLACGFANGDVLILDITSYTKKVIAQSQRETNPCFEPIWSVSWRAVDRDTEFLQSSCQDGRINKFTITKSQEFYCSAMMRITRVEGKIKGLEAGKACARAGVGVTRSPAALVVRWHPRRAHAYLVGTDEGCVHRCSTHYLNQHIDVFRAHAGPVYDMAFSPFMSWLLVTCGADGYIRLWIEGVDEPIVTLACPAAVYGVAFCPANSTLLLSTSGAALAVWDLRRKTHVPCAEYAFPGGVTLSYVHFAASGDNVFVGETGGRMHTFHLQDAPVPPYDQRRLLDGAVRRALCTRPELLHQLHKLAATRT